MAGGYPDGLRCGRPECATAPPTQLQRHSPTHAEFVTCNHTIERLINRLKQFRRVATRYEKRGVHYHGMLLLAAIKLWL